METCEDTMKKQNMLATHFNKSIISSLKGNIMYIYQLDNGAYKGKYSKNTCLILDLLSPFFKTNNNQ